MNIPAVDVSVNVDVRVAVAAVLVVSIGADVADVPEVVVSVDAALALLPALDGVVAAVEDSVLPLTVVSAVREVVLSVAPEAEVCVTADVVLSDVEEPSEVGCVTEVVLSVDPVAGLSVEADIVPVVD